jgi:ferric-dicitrate binding protein FerR (iron transport regulator)
VTAGRDDDYLWDPSAPADPEVASLEAALGGLKYKRPLALPQPRRARPRWPYAAGGAALAAAAALVFVLTRPDSRPRPCAVAGSGFRFEAIAGVPTCGGAETAAGWLPAGTWLDTGVDETARIDVADIGQIELRGDSRLALVATGPSEHRLELERGSLHAKVTAPPRLFVIETPTATAIDLGCEYDLEVSPDGTTTLTVTNGQVELAGGGRLTLVPMGATARTRTGSGPGLAWSTQWATPELRAAIDRFDGGDATAFDAILSAARPRDTVTLYNLLFRAADGAGRRRIYDRIDTLAGIPEMILPEDIEAGNFEAAEELRDYLWVYWVVPEQLPERADVWE